MKRSLLVFALVLICGRSAVGAEALGPALETPASKLAAALHCPATFDDADHEPVFLVHGTFGEDRSNWGMNYTPSLQALGYDVCTVDLPEYSTVDMQIQAEYVVYGVREIAARSGEKVDIIGSSQGTLHPRWAIKWWPDVRGSVDDLVQLAPPNHGTVIAAAPVEALGRCFVSCWQMATGSNYIEALNEGDETPGDISYTSIFTLFDELVQPQLPGSTSLLDGASNILIQDLCPGRPVGHVALAWLAEAVSYSMALDALEHPGPADPARFDITTCAQTVMEGSDPSILLSGDASGGVGDEFVTEEPPLKSYARPASSTDGGASSDPAPSNSDAEDDADAAPAEEAAVLSATQEVTVGEGSLPSSGLNILALVAIAVTLLAFGLVLSRTPAFRRSPQGDHRVETLP